MIYTARDLHRWNTYCRRGDNLVSGKCLGPDWLLARPFPLDGWRGFVLRGRAAFGVLTGRYDALDWEDRARGE